MNWSIVRQVLVREVRDQMRDRRTLFMIFVLPLLLYPLLGMSLFQVTQFIHEQPTRVLAVGFHELEGFPKLVRADEDGSLHFADELFHKAQVVRLLKVELKNADVGGPERAAAEARRAVEDGAYEAVVYFPPDFNDRLQGFRAQLRQLDSSRAEAATPDRPTVPSPDVFYNTAKEKSQLAYVRLKEVLDAWSDAVGRENLASRNLPVTTAKPFEFVQHDIAEEEERDAAMWSKILPLLLLIWALTGAFYPAIDLCAGEKERGTLETLLSSPAERSEIVWGKLLTVMLFSVATAVLNILSMGITGSMVLSSLPDFGPPPPLAPFWLFLALLPMSAMFSALCLALASFARSTREGQYYLMPLVLVTMPLVILPMAPGVELNLGMSLIPVTGVMLLLKVMLEGDYWTALTYLPPVAAITGACALLSIRWAVDQFNSESVLFRESERGGLGIWVRHLRRDREDTPTTGMAVMCGVLILTVYFFTSFALPTPNSFDEFIRSALISQIVVILLPALMMTIICTRSPRRTLLLERPAWWSMPAAILLALVLHPTALLVQQFLRELYPINPEVLKLNRLLGDGEPWAIVLALALVPAVCEELAFRGFILSGFRRIGNSWRAVVFASLFFGMSHGAAVQQAINAALVGLIIGYLAVQTSSILPGMLFHATHNAAAVLLTSWVAELTDAYPKWAWLAETDRNSAAPQFTYHPLIIAAGIVVAGAILRRFARLPHSLTYEEELADAIRERSEEATAA